MLEKIVATPTDIVCEILEKYDYDYIEDFKEAASNFSLMKRYNTRSPESMAAYHQQFIEAEKYLSKQRLESHDKMRYEQAAVALADVFSNSISNYQAKTYN